MDIGLGHLDRRGCRRIESRPCLQQADDLGAAVTGALHDLGDFRLGGPSHFDQVRNRNAGNRGIADERNHGVAMAAKDKGGDVFDRHLEFLGKEIAETRRIQNTCHADDTRGRQAGCLLQDADHDIERVGDADHEGVRAVVADSRANLLHDLGVDADQVVAAHSGLAGNTGGHDDDIASGQRLITVRALHDGIETLDRAGLRDVERLALGNAFGNVEECDVTELLEAGEERQGAPDIASTDERDLVAGHGLYS